MNKNQFLFTSAAFLLLLLTLATACKSNLEPQLPPLTQEGKNVMGCKINGKIWTTSGKSTFNHPEGVSFGWSNLPDSVLTISGTTREKLQYDIRMYPKYNGLLGNYLLTSSKGNFTDHNVEQPVMIGVPYYTDSTHTGWVKVSYYNGKIIAGTFEFDAVNDAGEVVHVTEGRFDIAQ